MRKRNAKRVKHTLAFLLSFLVFVLFSVVIFYEVLSLEEKNQNTIKDLPTIKISLLNTSLNEIHENGKEIKYGGNNLEISYDGVTKSYNNVEMKGRGNFSWHADKKSYQIKFSEKTNLFGMGKRRKWALVANSADNSLMRNDLAYFMSDILWGKYRAEGKFVNLLVDDEGGVKDLGVYYLVKTMEIDETVIDLKDKMAAIIEMDNAYCKEEDLWWEADDGNCFTVKDVATEGKEAEAMEDFIVAYNDFLEALAEQDFNKMNETMDVESLAKYFLFSEFTGNPDAYITSWYFYKDGLDDRIHAGVVWDFDAAFGNRDWGDWEDGFYDPTTLMSRFEYTFEKDEKSERVCKYQKENGALVSFVMCDVLEMPEFREIVRDAYKKEFSKKKEVIMAHIPEMAEKIRGAAEKDAGIWKKGSFDEAVSYLTWWVQERFKLFDELSLKDNFI